MLDPQVALALMPTASAFLLDDLKQLCEAALIKVTDPSNAVALARIAGIRGQKGSQE